MTTQQVYVNVDGYFSTYPSSATVLLRRVSNQQPCLISYPYGNGTVILTSMYTDWGAAHSQASTSELRLVRDLVTYAKNPNLAIPMFNLNTNFHPDISLNVSGEKRERECCLQSKDQGLYPRPENSSVRNEGVHRIGLGSGWRYSHQLQFERLRYIPTITAFATPITNFTTPKTTWCRWPPRPTAAASGFMEILDLILQRTPYWRGSRWRTNPFIRMNNPFSLFMFRTIRQTPLTPAFNIERNHRGSQPLFSMDVPANGNAEKTFAYDHQGAVRYWVTASGIERISKGIQIKYVRFENSLKTNSYNIGFSNPISFQFSSTNVTGKAVTGNIELKLLKGNQEIETLYSQVHEFGKDEIFAFSGSQIPTSALAPGYYRLKFECRWV